MKNSNQDIIISSSEDSEIRTIEETKIFNSIYLPQEKTFFETIKGVFSNIDNGTKKMYRLLGVWLIVVVFVTISFYVIKAIYV